MLWTASPYPKVICSILPRVYSKEPRSSERGILADLREALWDGAWNESGRNGVGRITCMIGGNDWKSLRRAGMR